MTSGIYGEALVFIDLNGYTLTASGMTFTDELTDGMKYRLLVSWTPYGVMLEKTGEWVA